MPNASAGAIATALAQMVSAAVIAFVLHGFYRQYQKTYLLRWTFGWLALVLYQITVQLNLQLALGLGVAANDPTRLVLAAIGGAAGFLNVGWLTFGVYELVRRRPIKFVLERRVLIGAVVLGIVTTLAVMSPGVAPEYRYTVRVGTRALIATAAFAWAGYLLWVSRQKRQGVGLTILAVALFAYAAEQLHYGMIGVTWIALGTQGSYANYIGYVDVVLQTVMGIGMVASLLEDEREAAELAGLQIEHLAYHDALTGLPNRPLFSDRLIMALAQASRTQNKLAILFLDLDRFKEINDSLGHSLGDSLLKAVAERIHCCLREGDTVARFGGDEFTLLIPRLEHVEDAAKIAQKIIDTLKIPFIIHEHELFITTSIGITIFPTDGNDPEMLVRNADTAMYRAKEQGRDNYQLYAPAMNAQALERLSLENTLRKAVSQNEFVLHYQPVIELKNRRVVGVEALVRWNHPELGLLLPVHFISVAEISGVILPLGEWVLRAACEQIRSWHRNAITISVNLSARQFLQPDLIQQVRRAVEITRIDPSRLQLEVTESNAMQHAANSIHILRELKALGIRIAMDDFGTGYSSLSYLKRFPIDTLKLDASFVEDIATDPTDAAIAQAVITMAHSLGIDVVAEGVERQDQLAVLESQGCDLIQGYLFSEPVDATRIDAFIEDNPQIHVTRDFRPAAEAQL
ncbi:MAG: EAL domain-containing protein [Thermoanaerobaculia bacterium]